MKLFKFVSHSYLNFASVILDYNKNRMKVNAIGICVCLLLIFEFTSSAANDGNLETCNDEKQFKILIKTKPNLLVLFSKSSKLILYFLG